MFKWDEKEVATVGDLFDAARKAARDGKAADFLAAYEQANEHAHQNLGYVIGYADAETRDFMYREYNLVHPIFNAAV